MTRDELAMNLKDAMLRDARGGGVAMNLKDAMFLGLRHGDRCDATRCETCGDGQAKAGKDAGIKANLDINYATDSTCYVTDAAFSL